MNTHANTPSVTAYVPWTSPTFTGARVTIAGTALQDGSPIEIECAYVADVARRPGGEADLLIVCRMGGDPVTQQKEIIDQLIAASACPILDVAQWLSDFSEQGGWWSAMADGRVGLGFSRCHFTDVQSAEARRMVAALSIDDRKAVEAEVRNRASRESVA